MDSPSERIDENSPQNENALSTYGNTEAGHNSWVPRCVVHISERTPLISPERGPKRRDRRSCHRSGGSSSTGSFRSCAKSRHWTGTVHRYELRRTLPGSGAHARNLFGHGNRQWFSSDRGSSESIGRKQHVAGSNAGGRRQRRDSKG